MKLIAIITMAIFEITLIGIAWAIVYIKPKLARKLITWSIKTLPNKEWYK